MKRTQPTFWSQILWDHQYSFVVSLCWIAVTIIHLKRKWGNKHLLLKFRSKTFRLPVTLMVIVYMFHMIFRAPCIILKKDEKNKNPVTKNDSISSKIESNNCALSSFGLWFQVPDLCRHILSNGWDRCTNYA